MKRLMMTACGMGCKAVSSWAMFVQRSWAYYPAHSAATQPASLEASTHRSHYNHIVVTMFLQVPQQPKPLFSFFIMLKKQILS